MANDEAQEFFIFPVRTWTDYCRESEEARPVLPETTAIPATEPPPSEYVAVFPLTLLELARQANAVRESYP